MNYELQMKQGCAGESAPRLGPNFRLSAEIRRERADHPGGGWSRHFHRHNRATTLHLLQNWRLLRSYRSRSERTPDNIPFNNGFRFSVL